jgi:ribonuclease HII
MPDYALEAEVSKRIAGLVAGVDEAGRGPFAGPVVAAAVILDPNNIPAGIDDSKRLSETRRETLFVQIMSAALGVGVGQASVAEIADVNILQATFRAMARAVAGLDPQPAYVLIDGRDAPDVGAPSAAVVKGDARSLSIAAASIIAKVTRDRIMRDLDREYPGYGWAKNKGYGTAGHRGAIARLGVTPHHRLSFIHDHNI